MKSYCYTLHIYVMYFIIHLLYISMYSKTSSAAVRTRLQSPVHTAADDDFDLYVYYMLF